MGIIPLPSRWARPILGALAVAVALALGYAGGVLTTKLDVPQDTSVEAGFARDMSTHHAQAVEMALIAYQRATLPEVRTMAYDIATSQEYQIGVMQTWLAGWHLSPTSQQAQMAWMPGGRRELTADGLMPGMASPAELDQLRKASGREVDVQFCQLMLRHHLGGLHMIDGVLGETDNSDVRTLAGSMRVAQSHEVTRMQQILAELGAQPK